MQQTATASGSTISALATRFREVRRASDRLVETLVTEDFVVQSMPDVSPTKWHLAHVTWFFETFLLEPADPDYRSVHPEFGYLFNSYYNTVGKQYPRPERGLVTRPTVDQVRDYRLQIDERISVWLAKAECTPQQLAVLELGLHHEQQHQELILMDIKHVLSRNPLYPVYREAESRTTHDAAAPVRWVSFPEELRWIGHGDDSFSFDNERPRHRSLVPAFELASRLVTNEEFLRFVEDGGYSRPEPWLADGWTTVSNEDWTAPLYWVRRDDAWHEFTLSGLRPLELAAPVSHLSYFEATAFASWAGARLATEAEWETAAERATGDGNFVEAGHHHPLPATGATDARPLTQMFGDLWEWTSSAYSAYPGFRAPSGALGEYNGKFMCNQYVLRGGSCATPETHIRPTYRNFFYPHCRWQFAGLRLARDA